MTAVVSKGPKSGGKAHKAKNGNPDRAAKASLKLKTKKSNSRSSRFRASSRAPSNSREDPVPNGFKGPKSCVEMLRKMLREQWGGPALKGC
ncbi:hypothetical protein JTE90_004605 [Oedothorax gibbosus]|uniref:Uncharacterized protein n=1 Tax=Oedothorax gibbosus TaxID=931172 RepID=A0AAV6TCV7_9ARAC|nr:hypothetical protein JTE90_004605 [Oedothorax gibbosus]